MRVKTGLIFLGATCGIFSLGALVAPPWADAHSAVAGLSNAHCLSGDAWAVTLTITATNPELGPVADIVYTGNDIHGVTVPYTHQFTTTAPTWTATAHITWSDGFTQDKGPFVATRPDGCTPPPTSGTTTTTTCAQAIPPRSDCAPPTEVTSSSIPTSPTSTLPIQTTRPMSPTTVATSVGIAPTATAPSVSDFTPTSIKSGKPAALPATGAGNWLLAVAAIGGIAILVGLVLVTAKRIDRSHEGER